MPPLPSTLDNATQDLIASLHRKHKDLHDFQIPRLRSCAGPLVTQQQYAAEIREDIEAFAKQIEALDLLVEDQKGERNRQELRRIVEEFKDPLGNLRKDSRAALLASKRAIDAKKASNRDELLRSSAVREKHQSLNEKVTEDALMTTSNNVTEALQRTIGLMQGELEKSVLTSQLLDQSTASLRSASTTHDVLDGLMVTSKHLITALEKSDWLDRLLIIAALAFLLLVILFILKQRLVDRSLRIVFWWTRFLPSRSSEPPEISILPVGTPSHITTATSTSSVLSTSLATTATLVAYSITSLKPQATPSIDTVPEDPSVELSESLSSITVQPVAVTADASATHDEL